MTVYPFSLDSDETIQRIDDNLSELGTQVINQLRSAVFAIEKQMGISPAGSLSSIANRLDVSLNSNGTLKASALASVGLLTFPLTDSQVASNAGIKEYKLTLDYSTADLNTQLTANSATLAALSTYAAATNSNLLAHIAGATILSDGSTPGRHVASQIDLNSIPFDTRDPFFTWNGLRDRDGNLRAATTVVEALLEINDAFVDHQNDQDGYAHYASGISVDTSSFYTIPQTADTVQKALDAIDQADKLVIKSHQANLHSGGVPREARSELLNGPDGYSQNIIPPTAANAYLVKPSAISPVDNNATGDDIISFSPVNTGYLFDAQFAQVNVGDIVRINYGNGIEATFQVESKRHLAGVEWIIRINGINLYNAEADSAIVRIDRPLFETNKYGTLAVAAANNDIYSNIMGSLIIGNPNAARALGIDFDSTQLDSTHYNLYLELYPTGNPVDATIQLPAIDVTGNQGTTPGAYTLEGVVATVNDAFRSGGYNYRFIAYTYGGEFGVMLSDTVNNVSFSITNGIVSGTVLSAGSFINNVVGDATDGKDALGFGSSKSAIASPAFTTTYASGLVAQSYPTKVLPPLRNRSYVVNGLTRDSFADTYLANADGYWDGYISNRQAIGATTVETTYTILLDLSAAKLKPGKTILIQPAIAITDPTYNSVDYGRFIIKNVFFAPDCPCPGDTPSTTITVVNSRHATGNPIGFSGTPQLPVQLYFSEDSVSFNESNVVDVIDTGDDYIRYHEVYVNEDGYTFTHERARMPSQTETISLLDTTTSWVVNEVSPKLLGFSDSLLIGEKFLRFYVLSYNTVSGEYDGYLGKKNGTSITDFGRVVTARKNVPTKFYDSNDVDFIELTFNELQQYPGKSILTTNVPRYVDIEIFPTLALDKEFTRLASCNLVGNYVSYTSDLRQFGNVSETDFSSSAIRFIESGDRLLHGNGVFAGFSYQGESSGTLNFNGGQALVNGSIITLSAQVIDIPEIVQDTGGGQTATLDWAICVNSSGVLQAIPVTSTKTQFFARRLSDTDNYYIQSATFSEIVNARKDLAIIAMANVTIASITVNSVRDARKFIESETSNIPLTLYGSDEINVVGNFTTFEQVKEWANGFGTNGMVVKVRGTILIDEEIDLTNITNQIIFDGSDGGEFTVTSPVGIKINKNIFIKNTKINYETVFTGLSSGLAHLEDGYGCILIDSVYGVGSDNINISDCVFSREAAGERAPYILLSAENATLNTNIKIIDNTFVSTNDSNYNCSIGLYNTGFGAGPAFAIFSAFDVKGNIVGGSNSILLTTGDNDYGIVPSFINIMNNTVHDGVIGYRVKQSSAGESSLAISNNSVKVIGTFGKTGVKIAATPGNLDPFNDGSGTVIIDGNKCNRIYVHAFNPSQGGTNIVRQLTNITNNVLIADQFSTLTQWGYTTEAVDGYGIAVYGDNIGAPVLVENNRLNSAYSTYTYYYPIHVNVAAGVYGGGAASVKNNMIHRFIRTGIYVKALGYTVISGNDITRDAGTVVSYITADMAADVAFIYENMLDQRTTQGTDVVTIVATDGAYIERNINYIKTVIANGSNGEAGIMSTTLSFGDGPVTYAAPTWAGVIENNLAVISRYASAMYATYTGNNSSARYVHWNIPLYELLPHGAKILSATFLATREDTDMTGVNCQLILKNNTSIIAGYNSGLIAVSTTANPLISGVGYRLNTNTFLNCIIGGINNTGNTASLSISAVTITYTY